MQAYRSIPTNYSRTSTPLPPTPRRVRGLLRNTLGDSRIIFIPHFLVGVAVTIYVLFLITWAIFGRDVPGKITGTDVTYSSKRGNTYSVKYSFKASGVDQSGSDVVDLETYRHFQNIGAATGRDVLVRYLAIGSLRHSATRQYGSLLKENGPLFLWVCFWDTIVSIFVYQFWIKPLRVAALYKNGQAVDGTLLSKRASRGRSSTYYVTARFRDFESKQDHTIENEVWNIPAWTAAKDGDAVTILYDVRNPRRCAVYEISGYVVDSAGESDTAAVITGKR